MSNSFYEYSVNEQLKNLNRGDVEARHVEAYMRLKYGTLDSLGYEEFRKEVKLCVKAIDAEGKKEAETLAQSYGL